jgi:hypothetical protein
VDFQYIAPAEAANFKFSKRGGLSATIGHHWKQSQVFAQPSVELLCPLVADSVRWFWHNSDTVDGPPIDSGVR